MTKIHYAGYGCYNSTTDVTAAVQGLRTDYNATKFTCDAAIINGSGGNTPKGGVDVSVGDPAPGKRKYLYIVWQVEGDDKNMTSGVVGGDDSTGITVPGS